MGMGHSGTKTRWDRDTMGQRHDGNGTQWDEVPMGWDTMELRHDGTQ